MMQSTLYAAHRDFLRSSTLLLLALLRRLAIVDAAYFLLVLATTLRAPKPIPAPRMDDAVCRAHRCVAVVSVDRVASQKRRLQLRGRRRPRQRRRQPQPLR